MITGYHLKVGGVIKSCHETDDEAVQAMVAEANALAQRNRQYVLTRHGLYSIEVGHAELQSRFAVRVAPIAACPCCTRKLSTYWQPGGAGVAGYWAGTCQDEACLLIGRTLPLEQFESEARLAFQRDDARKRRQRDAQRRSRARRQAAQKAIE